MKSSSNPGGTAGAVFAVTLFFLGSALHAQAEPGTPHRPKIGLVLSGGGAPGVAHVGVLKALEELRIPLGCITGTSVGAITGGLYASGMSPAQIEDWLTDADWNFLLSDSVPRESESFRGKQRDFDLHQSMAFSVTRNMELKLPAGLTTARNLMANLRELTIPVRHIRDFDRLPIPFRAAATDVETGELVVLGKGDLVEAVRASMSVPAIFTPQKIDGHLLVDGGLVANLPIQTAQEMGADVIIAVDIVGWLQKESGLDSAGAMADQVLGIFMKNQTRGQLARLGPGDAYVRLKVEGVGPTDFPKAAASIRTGYEQTMQQRAALARFSVSPGEYARYLAGQRVPREKAILISFLKVQTPAGEFEHRLGQPIELETKDPARFARLQSTVADLGEMQKFEARDYEVIGRPGAYGLLIKAREKKGGPTFLNFGFDYGYSSADVTDFNFLLSLRMTELNSLGGEWDTFLSLGDSTRVVSDWYQPVDWQRRFFFATQVLFGSDFIDGRNAAGGRLRFRQQDWHAGLDVGTRLGQAGELRVGFAHGETRLTRRAGVPAETPDASDRGWMHADFTADTLDAPSFARRGYYGRVSVAASREEFGADDNYTRLEGQFYMPLTFGKNTIVPRVTAAVKLGGGAVPLYDQVPLGGFLNLSGLARGGLFDQNAALAEVIYYRKLADLSPAMGRAIYGGFSIEAGDVWADARDFDAGNFTYGGSLFLGADTVLGAVHLGVGLTEGGNAAVYLQLGPVFRQGRHQR